MSRQIRTKVGFREPGQWTFNELDARRLIAIHDAARAAVADASAVSASPHLMALSDAIAKADSVYGSHPKPVDLTDEEFDSARRKAAEELASFVPGERVSLFEGISDDEAGRKLRPYP